MATTYISKIKQIGGNEEYVIKDAEAREQIATKAPLASPALTGTPTAPTPAAGTNTTQIATTAFVTSALTGVSSPMRFIGSLGTGGTVTSLPAASATNQGYTYKVITANTYQGVAAKVGDMLVSNGSSWILIPSGDEPSGTVTSVETGVGLTGGSITSSGTIKAKLRSETALTNDSAAATEISDRVYPVAVDKSGYLAVNVPWTNVNNSYLTSHQTVTNKDATLSWGTTSTIATIGSTDIKVTMPANPDTHHMAYLRAGASEGTVNAATTTGNTYLNLVENEANRSGVKLAPGSNMSITSDANGVVTFAATDTTYGIATNTTNGLVKPWYTHTAASTGPTTGSNATAIAVNTISTTAGKYYAVEADNNGRLFVNVPWTNVNDSYVTSSGVTSITLSSGTGISVSDSGTAITSTGSRTISLASINGLTTGTYGPTGSNTILTPSHEGTFTVPTFSVDTYGRITSASNYTVKLPSDADTKVKQTASSTNTDYKLLFTTTASPTSGTAYETYYDSAITVNPSTDTITATTFVGKMSKGITIGDKTYNGSSDIIINSSDLGLTSPMTFKGVSITNLSDGATTSPITLKGETSLTPSEGDVVLDSTDNEEYIWSGNKWNAMGIASSYAMAQHTHGNIANDGSLGSDVTIANGDKIVVTDASDSNKISRASISFDGSTTTKALSQKGTWESFLPISGGTLTGNVTLDKMTGSSANYGDELPATGTEGQIFFKVGGVESKVDSFYPVGSIYMSVSSANPGTLFGGTWERIEDCFLLAAGTNHSAGSTGGEETHTLTVDEMPIHNGHLTSTASGGTLARYLKTSVLTAYGSSGRGWTEVSGDEAMPASNNRGGSQPHNNMPPYIAVYMWKRIA